MFYNIEFYKEGGVLYLVIYWLEVDYLIGELLSFYILYKWKKLKIRRKKNRF